MAEPIYGGTNLCLRSDGCIFCLLNGAFTPHAMGGQYKKSRGLVTLEVASSSNPESYFKKNDLAGIEPFTLVKFSQAHPETWVWDGQVLWSDFQVLHRKPRLWASAQLYASEARNNRKNWFANWLQHEQRDANSLHKWHLTAGNGDYKNDLVMNRRNLVRTVSSTAFAITDTSVHILHTDILNEKYMEFNFQLPYKDSE